MKHEIIVEGKTRLDLIIGYLKIIRGHESLKLNGDGDLEAFAICLDYMLDLAKKNKTKNLEELRQSTFSGSVKLMARNFKGTYEHFNTILHRLRNRGLLDNYNIPKPFKILYPILKLDKDSELNVRIKWLV